MSCIPWYKSKTITNMSKSISIFYAHWKISTSNGFTGKYQNFIESLRIEQPLDNLAILDNFKSMKNIHIRIHVRLVHRHPDNQGLVVHMTKVTVPQPNGLVVMEVVPVLDLVQVNHKELKIKHFCLANLKFSWSQIRIHKLWIISKDS